MSYQPKGIITMITLNAQDKTKLEAALARACQWPGAHHDRCRWPCYFVVAVATAMYMVVIAKQDGRYGRLQL
jgi:hypothetical protein